MAIAAFLVLIGMLIGGLWIGVCLALAGMIILYFFGDALPSAAVASWNLLFNFSLAALPLYILLGEILVHSGLARRGYDAIAPLMERFPGRLLLTNVGLDTLLGAVVGSSLATASIVGSIAYPELSSRSYDRKALVGNLAGAGTLGSFVPPSLILILYGAWVQVSVGVAFVAALVPALITSGLFISYVVIASLRNPNIAPSTGKELVPLGRAIIATKDVWPIIVLLLSIIVTIYFGVATATEAAGISIMIAIVIACAFKSFSFRKLYDSLRATANVTGMIGFILIGASIFCVSIARIGLPRQIILGLEALQLPSMVIIIGIYILYIVLGCFFDGASIMLMTLPFTFPLMLGLGADPFWFGVVMVIVIEMGLITPPVGLNLYIIEGITKGQVTLGEVAAGCIPYFLMLLVTLALITVFPQLCTWLPALMP